MFSLKKKYEKEYSPALERYHPLFLAKSGKDFINENQIGKQFSSGIFEPILSSCVYEKVYISNHNCHSVSSS